MAWEVGQKAVIGRQLIVTIDRVMPSGRATANGKTFDVDGRERSASNPYRRAILEHLTPEIQAEMDLVRRGRKASIEAASAVEDADKWLRRAFNSWGGKIPVMKDVETAEKITSAIRALLGERG